MKRYLKRLASFVYGRLLVARIHLVIGQRFWLWRIRLWLAQLHIFEATYTGMKQTLLIIRHGQTGWNVEHKLPGQLSGISLNEKGREQAARLAESLAAIPISAIISSPLERAYDTALILARGRGLAIQTEPDLMDTDIGRWAGESYQQLGKTDPDWKAYVQDPTLAPAGIETFPQVQQRVLAALERWRKRPDIGAYPAFVAHADVVKLIIAYYSGLEIKRAGALFIDNASVSIIEIENEEVHPVRVVAVGWSPHPGWLKPSILDKQKDDIPAHEGEQKA
jgi:broad specificity phosphatase PhoE